MISTAGYYCSNGHVWESTTSTAGHDAVLRQPCLDCMLTSTVATTMTIHGPFPSMEDARVVMERRASA